MEKVNDLRLSISQDSKISFLSALDAEGVPHGEVVQFSKSTQGAAINESISALSEVMPWNSIAKVMIAWLETKKSRQITINTKDGKVINLKGYSESEAKKIIKLATSATITDASLSDEI